MRYFDLHIHPSTKSSLCVNKTAWDEVRINDDAKKWLRSFRNVIDSQANLKHLTENNYEVVVAPLVGLEKAFAGNVLIKNILPKYSALDKTHITGILKNKISYYQSFLRDRDNLVNSIKQQPGKVVLVNKPADYDASKLNVLIAIEGAHCFKHGDTDPVANFRAFRQQHRVLYFTLTHLSRAEACNHAYGVRVKVSLTGKDTDEEIDDVEISAMGTSREFMPWGKGFFMLGANLVKECYNQPKDQVTLVDVKHMSFYSRQYLYAMRAANGWTHIPLVASHMGVTGTSLERNTYVKRFAGVGDEQIKRLKFWRKKGLGNTLFNPWTINLYDEDILAILQSRGLIGISFDQRIVGAGKVYPELFSNLELQKNDALSIYRHLKKSRRNPDPDQYSPWNEVESGADNEESPKDYLEDILEGEGDMPEVSSIVSFVNNLLHIIKVGLQAGYTGAAGKVHVWDHVCIGSDLDGLIDSLDFAHDKFNAVTASTIQLLIEKLRTDIKMMAAYDPYFDYQIDDIDTKLEKLFSTNGKNFVGKFLSGTLF
jgi:microsomal dipeptidase-like Zn-dependent dipeptidase